MKKKIKGKIIMLSSIYGPVIAQNVENYYNTNIKENMNYFELNL